MPEWNKATLQAYIGLDMKAEEDQKQQFLREVLPRWQESAAKKQPGPTDYVPLAKPKEER
jgi:formate-dependent nitrite reductase cytochrome c552 subunit